MARSLRATRAAAAAEARRDAAEAATEPDADGADGLKARIRAWAVEAGFSAAGFATLDLGDAPQRLRDWLAAGHHGEMDYLARHVDLRADPRRLVPGALSVISVRMPYLPAAESAAIGGGPAQADDAAADHGVAPAGEMAAPGPGDARAAASQRAAWATLADPARAYVARYALGRDYHKLVRARLEGLARRIEAVAGPLGRRVFCDSAPVLEVEFASRAGIGWRGKHTLLLSRDEGSWFFLGEIITTLDLPADAPASPHCGSCTACIDVCPTRAIVAPYTLDARRCISYLTIEHAGPIPEPLRPLMGNRIYGCDDCQLACPWNRYARISAEPDFAARHRLDSANLVELFGWDEATFLERTAGSAIRRIGHARWLRNIAVALGNAPPSPASRAALLARANHADALVREHVAWALRRQAAGVDKKMAATGAADQHFTEESGTPNRLQSR
ncbi:MAG: tRNA epoxyqueuosine(34) reductase QueG [Rhodocyclaceae bacterium]|nr:tRNA epoxyqueuosine(34) reductase QueG [Rhodocyclaceae bacterium]